MKRIPKTAIPVLLSIMLLLGSTIVSGCLTVETKEYHVKLKNGTSGEATIRFINIISESDDTTDITNDDFQQLIDMYVKGNKFEKDNPGYRNLKKKLYEENGVLVGEVTFSFDSLSAVRIFKFDKDSPYMFYASNPLSSETLIETNGMQPEVWMPVVFWKKDAREFFVKTRVSSEARFRASLLKNFVEWQTAQSKKK
ncbi:MAG: hypothetical protein KF749_18255 [Bacteroidetes bacterium]|nr:hypothetical protein [Bacteroidota bacterium]MCW5895268.1 hypothetical protein [Bacteroidota bacterium]